MKVLYIIPQYYKMRIPFAVYIAPGQRISDLLHIVWQSILEISYSFLNPVGYSGPGCRLKFHSPDDHTYRSVFYRDQRFNK